MYWTAYYKLRVELDHPNGSQDHVYVYILGTPPFALVALLLFLYSTLLQGESVLNTIWYWYCVTKLIRPNKTLIRGSNQPRLQIGRNLVGSKQLTL